MDLNELSPDKLEEVANRIEKEAEKGFSFNLRHCKTWEELDAVITVKGIRAKGFMDKLRTTDPKQLSDVLAEYTIGWENIEIGKETYPFSVSNAKKLYTDFEWIGSQVATKVFQELNLLKG